MHIGFDNSRRLRRKVYYFEYKGTRFKLIQNNPRLYSDVLLTIVPDLTIPQRRDHFEAQQTAFQNAAEFLSALSWQNNSIIRLTNLGGPSNGRIRNLRKAKCGVFSFPQIPFLGARKEYNLWRIPYIQTPTQADALALFREASSSNNEYLAFLFYWQILEMGKGHASDWVNKTYIQKRDSLFCSDHDLTQMPLNGKTLGKYFYEDCRCAIAHICKPKPGNRIVRVDELKDIERISVSKRVIKAFARLYIKDVLGLNKTMYLFRKGAGFPVFVSEDEMKNREWWGARLLNT